jgi:hypothetical protein
MKNKYISLAAGAGLLASLAFALSVSAASAQTQVTANVGGGTASASVGFHGGPGPARIPGVFGTVSAINGTSLTVTSKTFDRNASTTSPTVYTVDASNAQIYKNSTTTTTIASIATGDTVMVQGTISGTNVAATVIRDGMGGMMMGGKPGMGRGGNGTSTMDASSTPIITGNGEPVVAGSITAVNGTTITITNASNVTYTVDASNAKIVKNGTTTAITNLATGDNLVVQGTVNGTSVTASSVIDQGVARTSTASSTAPHAGGAGIGGLLGSIGGFFKHLFGF